ncbi:hypothetical protein BKA01_000957 [Pseudonocardia eucalypti]|uniref:hypothetical protein n=1 Tax=Pseudonocardia eucalypti TaxID=648755 RepID=UPI001622BA24|nr:hypothetical protein [Pseudonocardia eucalypti]
MAAVGLFGASALVGGALSDAEPSPVEAKAALLIKPGDGEPGEPEAEPEEDGTATAPGIIVPSTRRSTGTRTSTTRRTTATTSGGLLGCTKLLPDLASVKRALTSASPGEVLCIRAIRR